MARVCRADIKPAVTPHMNRGGIIRFWNINRVLARRAGYRIDLQYEEIGSLLRHRRVETDSAGAIAARVELRPIDCAHRHADLADGRGHGRGVHLANFCGGGIRVYTAVIARADVRP